MQSETLKKMSFANDHDHFYNNITTSTTASQQPLCGCNVPIEGCAVLVAGLAVHGWWLTLASFRLKTAIMLAVINHLAYWVCEANLVLTQPGYQLMPHSWLYYASLMLVTTIIPLDITSIQESRSRRQFVQRHHIPKELTSDSVQVSSANMGTAAAPQHCTPGSMSNSHF